MKKVFVQYAAYNVWANQKIVNTVNKLTDEQCRREINSSFNGIHLTLVHLWNAESIWWQRLKLMEHIEVPGELFSGSTAELCSQLLKQSKLWKEWAEESTDAALEHEFIYRNTKKEQFKQPVYEMMLHLFNHSTYHRGQLITLFRQVGFEQVPNTDLISFLRKK